MIDRLHGGARVGSAPGLAATPELLSLFAETRAGARDRFRNVDRLMRENRCAIGLSCISAQLRAEAGEVMRERQDQYSRIDE